MENVLQQIVDAINFHALPRAYDWLMLLVTILSIAVATAVAIFTYRIYNKQLDLMKKQKEISQVQTKISEQQTNIMSQQNKIALFEKRYKCYVSISVMEQILEYVCSYLEKNPKCDRATRAHFIEKNIKTVFETAGYDTSTDNRYKMAINTLSENVNCIGLLFDVDEPTEVNLHAYTKEFQKSLLLFAEEEVTYEDLNDIKNTISEYNSNFKDTIFEKQLKL